MKKFVAMILVVVMMATFGCTAFAVYDEETELIEYELIVELSTLGMKPNYDVNEDGYVWTVSGKIEDIADFADDLDGVGTVYGWYNVEENIGELTIVGQFSFSGEDEQMEYYSMVFEWQDDYGFYTYHDMDEVFW